MSRETFETPLTVEELKERLSYAACGLDKIASWTEKDEENYGDQGQFARQVLDMVFAPSKVLNDRRIDG